MRIDHWNGIGKKSLKTPHQKLDWGLEITPKYILSHWFRIYFQCQKNPDIGSSHSTAHLPTLPPTAPHPQFSWYKYQSIPSTFIALTTYFISKHNGCKLPKLEKFACKILKPHVGGLSVCHFLSKICHNSLNLNVGQAELVKDWKAIPKHSPKNPLGATSTFWERGFFITPLKIPVWTRIGKQSQTNPWSSLLSPVKTPPLARKSQNNPRSMLCSQQLPFQFNTTPRITENSSINPP
jgi:hypothetical protein